MTSYLADTNILSELVRRQPDPGVLAWAEGLSTIGLSVISVEEVFFGLAAKPNVEVRRWFEEFFHRCEIFPVGFEVAARAGEMRGQLRAEGRARTEADMLIAATAEFHQLTLVTRNTRHFEGCRIPLMNPFTG